MLTEKLRKLTPKKIARKLRTMLFSIKLPARQYSLSYSQAGEDMIIRTIANSLKIEKSLYIDIGAHDPYHISNTAYLYAKGWRGINIEANPTLHKNLARVRRRDINLNLGVAMTTGVLDFYIMNSQGLSTFSKEEAENNVQKHGMRIEQTIKVPVDTLEHIINTYCPEKKPDLLTIDVEGLDEQILRSIDFSWWKPAIICCEITIFQMKGLSSKNESLINYLENNGYYLWGSTYFNGIFVDKNLWEIR